jgi:hypothetical protein
VTIFTSDRTSGPVGSSLPVNDNHSFSISATIASGEIVVSSFTSTTIHIIWGGTEGATAYLLYIGDGSVEVVSTLSRLSFTFKDLVPGQAYRIRLQMSGINVDDIFITQRTGKRIFRAVKFLKHLGGAADHSLALHL